MTYAAISPHLHEGRVVDDGQCVAFVRRVCNAPHTSQWRKGAHVRSGGDLPSLVAIATFDPNGRYGNHTDGRSHCAVLIERRSDGLLCWDQWLNQPVHKRLIRYRGGSGPAANDGDAFYVIARADPEPAAAT
jgi:hypothetical protein